MSQHSSDIEWAIKCLSQNEPDNDVNMQTVVETPWSKVIKLVKGGKKYYLKTTPPDLHIEAQIINEMNRSIYKSPTPNIIAINKELSCFLMNEVGELSLRAKFNNIIDAKLWLKGLESYTKIIKSSDNNIDNYLCIGVPDWRLNKLPELFIELISNYDLLKSEGLSDVEIDSLFSLENRIKDICCTLDKGHVKQSIINSDFNENNLILNTKSEEINVVDLGECVISHPFLSIATHLGATARRYKLDINCKTINNIKAKWLSSWYHQGKENETNKLFLEASKLLPIFVALSTHRLYKATDYKCIPLVSFKISECLKLLLK